MVYIPYCFHNFFTEAIGSRLDMSKHYVDIMQTGLIDNATLLDLRVEQSYTCEIYIE